MDKSKLLAKKLKEAYEYFAIFANKENNSNLKVKDNVIFFDKDCNVYLLRPNIVPARYTDEYAYHTFKLYVFDSRNLQKKSRLEKVGQMGLRIYKDHSYLEEIEILNQTYLNKGLGSNMIKYASYLSSKNNFSCFFAYILSLNTFFINNEDLVKFYTSIGAEIKGPHAKISFTPSQIENYENQIINIKQGNLNFKIMVPNGLKKQLYPLIKPKNQESDFKNIDVSKSMML